MKTNIIGVTVLLLALISCGSFRILPHMIARSNEGLEQRIMDITPQQAYELITCNADNPDFVILDIRTAEEYDSGHIEQAELLDFYSDSFQQELDQLKKNNTYLVYCRSGNRSGTAMKIMRGLRFTEVYNLTGGISRWAKEEYPIVISG
jgi:rhodanese-related sulfurtransferase